MFLNFCALWSVALKSAPLTNLFGVRVDYRIFLPNNEIFTEFNSSNFNQVSFPPTKNYVILAHGWINNFTNDFYDNTIQRFRPHKDKIVITLGYEEAMSCRLYVGSVILLTSLGREASKLILHMNSVGVPLSQIEMAGHSLGAHVAGIAGKMVFKATNKKIRRIFGLDPAFPLIPALRINADSRLTQDDAQRVIILHTSILGIQREIGHVDFYPNGGKIQFECGTKYRSSHNVATMYFYCSINNDCQNIGYQCTSFMEFQSGRCRYNHRAAMGYHVADEARGSYYLYVKC